MSISTIAAHLAHHKERFIGSLRYLLASNSPIRPQSSSFFYSLFQFGRLCADSNLSIADQFNLDEKKQLANDLRKGLPIIEQALVDVHSGMDPSLLHGLKQVRSSVQFLADDFTFLDEFDEEKSTRLSELLKEIPHWDRVQDIDEELPDWEKSGGGEFYVPVDPINLANMPKSHSWWTDADRSSSKN